MSKSQFTLGPCAKCYVRVKVANPGIAGGHIETEIVSCPLHAAAPALHAALKPFALAAGVFDQFSDEGLWANNVTIGELRRARAPLALVDGEAVSPTGDAGRLLSEDQESVLNEVLNRRSS